MCDKLSIDRATTRKASKNGLKEAAGSGGSTDLSNARERRKTRVSQSSKRLD